MKLLWFLTWRDIRFRYRELLPFVLSAAALIFTSVAQVTFQESLNTAVQIDYMMTPTYGILLSAFSLIGFASAKTYFSLYSERLLAETGVRRAMGLRRRDIRRSRMLLGFLCIAAAAIPAVPLALLYIFLFVASGASGDMELSNFTPLVYRIPYGNIGIVLFLLISVMMLGVLTGYAREKSIVSLLRRGKMPPEAESGAGELPEEGTLRDYGRLYVRRSLRRCVKYNLVTALLLILPVIFLLGASTVRMDGNTHDFALSSTFDTEKMAFVEITDEMIAEVAGSTGVQRAEGIYTQRKGFGDGYFQIFVYAEEDADPVGLCERMSRYAEEHSLRLEESAVLRDENNRIARHYHFFFLTDAALLFAVGFAASSALLKSRLTARRRELTLLRAVGARTSEIVSAVVPETAADYAFGSFLSAAFGALGFWGMMADGGGRINPVTVALLCLLFLAGNLWIQVRISRGITEKILSEGESEEHF